MNAKYIYPVRPDIIREITKRGVFENKKDSDGNIIRKRNEHGSSCFGWGTVDDTIPIHKRELENIRRTLDVVVGQIKTSHYLEKEPTKIIPDGKRAREVEIPEPSMSVKKSKIPHIISDWFDFMNEKLESGQIGFVPDCFQDSIPSLEDFIETNSGQILSNFCKFNKMIW